MMMKPKFIAIIAVIIIISEISVISYLPQIRWMIWRAQNWNYTTNSWVKTWHGSDSTWGRQMAIDGEDNIYLFALGQSDDYLLKYTNKGELKWTKKIDIANFESLALFFLVLNSQGDIFLAGNIDQFSAYAQVPDNNVVLLKFNKSGEQQWIKTYSGHDLSDMQIDSNDDLYLLTKSVSGSNITTIMLKIEESGALIWNSTLWEENLGWQYYHESLSLLINQDGDIYVGGLYKENYTLFKCNSSGVLQKNITLSEKKYSYCFSMALDNNNDVIFYELYHLFKVNSSMNIVWNVNNSIYAHFDCAIIVNSNNEILLTISTTAPCLSNSLFSYPACICTSITLEKFSENGDLISSILCTGCCDAATSDIALDSQNNIYILGTLSGKWRCINLPYELVLFKNPRSTSLNCIIILQDLLFLLIVPTSIIAAILIFRINKKAWERDVSKG